MLPIGSMLQHVFLSFRFGVYIPKFLREITQDSAGIYLSINDEKILWNSKDTVMILSLSWAFDWKRLTIGISQSEKIKNAIRPNPFAPRHEPAQQEVPDRAAQYIQVVKREKEGIGGTERKEGVKDQVAQHMQVVKKGERENRDWIGGEVCFPTHARDLCWKELEYFVKILNKQF